MNWSQEMKVHTDICVHINFEKFESAKQFPLKKCVDCNFEH